MRYLIPRWIRISFMWLQEFQWHSLHPHTTRLHHATRTRTAEKLNIRRLQPLKCYFSLFLLQKCNWYYADLPNVFKTRDGACCLLSHSTRHYDSTIFSVTRKSGIKEHQTSMFIHANIEVTEINTSLRYLSCDSPQWYLPSCVYKNLLPQ